MLRLYSILVEMRRTQKLALKVFVLKDHANDDGTEIPKELVTPFDYNDAANIWKAVDENSTFTQELFW